MLFLFAGCLIGGNILNVKQVDLQKGLSGDIAKHLESVRETMIRMALCTVVTTKSAMVASRDDIKMIFQTMNLKGEFILGEFSQKERFILYRDNKKIKELEWEWF